MVKKCIICRVEGSPGCDRSFHLFPKDESKRQTWLQALGLVTSPNFKTAYVCSAHFGADCYADEDDQRTRRKLLSTAVPHISRPASSNIQNVLTESNCDPGDNVNSPGDNVNSDVNSTCISSEVFDGETTSITNTNEDGESIDNASCKRKRVCISECENPSKKIKFMHGHRVQYLSRQDFTSNESWEKFLNFTRIQKSKLAAARNKHLRKQKKLKSLSSLICDLKKSQETAAATYLQVKN